MAGIVAQIARAGNLEIQGFQLEGFQNSVKLDSMKTTIDIPEKALADVLVVACAQHHKAELLHRDAHLERLLVLADRTAG